MLPVVASTVGGGLHVGVTLVARLGWLLTGLVVVQASGNFIPGFQTIDELYHVNDEVGSSVWVHLGWSIIYRYS